jgi:hypothetical protein
VLPQACGYHLELPAIARLVMQDIVFTIGHSTQPAERYRLQEERVAYSASDGAPDPSAVRSVAE